MEQQHIVNRVLNANITQERLGNYLEITRQTVAKLSRGDYVKLSSTCQKRLLAFDNKSDEDIRHMIALTEYMKSIQTQIMTGDSDYVKKAHEGFKYMHYWMRDDKFNKQAKYHTYYFGHMNNFYPRFNQAALFMRDTLDRQKYPLLTYQIDYQNKLITNFCLKAFVEKHDKPSFSTKHIHFPITFQAFLDHLKQMIKPSPRFLIYKDYLDDDWQYILDHVKKQWIHKEEIYDLSRLLNFFGNEQNYFGPLIEDALDNFNILFDRRRIHFDCAYRAEQIVRLINMISLEKLHNNRPDKSNYLFDSHGFKGSNAFVLNERRKLKKEI